jgi:hypothetical protein
METACAFIRNSIFREYPGKEHGCEDGSAGILIRQIMARTGIYIMGERMLEKGEEESNRNINIFITCIRNPTPAGLNNQTNNNFRWLK